MKKFISLLLIATMVVSTLSVSYFAIDDNSTQNNTTETTTEPVTETSSTVVTTEPVTEVIVPTTTFPKPIVNVKAVKLNKSIVNLSKKGSTVTLKATVTPNNATNALVDWKANNTKVATVDSKGKIKATTNKGTTYVNAIAKDGSKKSARVLVIVGEKVKKITLNKTSITLNRGGKNRGFQLKKTIKNKNATYKGVNWYSSNKNVATVNSKGKVTLKKKGRVTITVKAKDGSNKYARCKIVVKQLVTKLSYNGNKQAKEVVKGKTINFSVSVTPSDANNKNLAYTSSNKKIATVDSKGTIKGIKAGTITITAKAKDKSKKKVSLKVRVKNPPISDDTIIKSAKVFKNPKIVQRICNKLNNYFKSCGAKIESRLRGTHQWYVTDTSVAFNDYYGTSINEAYVETLGYWVGEFSGDFLKVNTSSDGVKNAQWNGIRDWDTYLKFFDSLTYKDKQGRERPVEKLVTDKKYNGFDWYINKYCSTQFLVYVDYEKMKFRGKDYKDDDGNQEYIIKFYHLSQGFVDEFGWDALKK